MTRLLTLTGPGGVGKSRIAIQVAGVLRPAFSGGVGFVPLASIRDPGLVLPTIAQAIGARQDVHRTPVESIRAALRGRHCLLVLDNFEQVATAAPAVTAMLSACPDLTILVTSRTPLRISGELEYPIPPLSLDHDIPTSPADTSSPVGRSHDSESTRLFIARATAARADMSLDESSAPIIAEICARLDGLPLAIELAAGQVRFLPPPALLARLRSSLPLLATGPRDAPARQRTMRDAIAWSYDLLTPPEQSIFRRLAVFSGPFTLDAAEHVAGEGRPDDEEAATTVQPTPRSANPPLALLRPDRLPSVRTAMSALVEHSLVRTDGDPPDESRYLLLETIREFSLEQLAHSGEEAAVRERHAAYFLALAEDVEPNLFGPEQTRWRAKLAVAQDNLHVALTWFAAIDSFAIEELRLAGALVFHWVTGSRFTEGRQALEHALGRAPDAPAAIRARALLGLGFIAHYHGDEEAAITAIDQGLALAEDEEPSYNLAFGHYARGIVAEDTGDYPLAVEHLTQAVVTFQSIDQPAYAELARFHLGVVLFGRGDLADANAAIAEALQRLRDLGCHITVAATADFHGLVAFALNNPAAALARYREALSLTTSLRTPEGIVRGLAGVATVAAGDDPAAAARFFAASAAASESSGYTAALPERAVFDRAIGTARAVLGRATFQEAWTAGHTLSPDQALAEALDWLAAARHADPAAPRPQFGGLDALTPRERQVLRLLVAGRSNKDIAIELFISAATVKRHVSNILAKLDVTTRSAAIAHALTAGRPAQPPRS